MSFLIKWDNVEKTVVLQQYNDQSTQYDLYYLAAESAEMLKSVSHTVHLIIDERTTKMTLSSEDIKFLEMNVPPNQGAVVMLIDKSGMAYKKLMQDVGKTLGPKTFSQPYFAETLEEARNLLAGKFAVQYP